MSILFSLKVSGKCLHVEDLRVSRYLKVEVSVDPHRILSDILCSVGELVRQGRM